jgi:hypothetical protein
MDILLAPTVDILKVKQEESIMHATLQRSMNIAKKHTHEATDDSLNDTKQSFRLVPETAAEAHSIAVASVKALLGAARQDNEAVTMRRTIKRQNSITLKRGLATLERREAQRKKNEPRSAKPTLAISNAAPDLTIDELFIELSVDIAEQRKALPLHQRDAFDDKWG